MPAGMTFENFDPLTQAFFHRSQQCLIKGQVLRDEDLSPCLCEQRSGHTLLFSGNAGSLECVPGLLWPWERILSLMSVDFGLVTEEAFSDSYILCKVPKHASGVFANVKQVRVSTHFVAHCTLEGEKVAQLLECI